MLSLGWRADKAVPISDMSVFSRRAMAHNMAKNVPSLGNVKAFSVRDSTPNLFDC